MPTRKSLAMDTPFSRRTFLQMAAVVACSEMLPAAPNPTLRAEIGTGALSVHGQKGYQDRGRA
jgi:hypothetical protein